MNSLIGTKIKDLSIDNDIVLKDDISSYLQMFLSKEDGGTVSNDLSITGNINVGFGNSVIGNHQCAIGESNIVGSRSILIVGVDKNNLQLSCQYSGTLDQIKEIENRAFVVYSQGACGNDSIVTSVEQTDQDNIYRLTISKWYAVLNKADANRYLLAFPDIPEFGDFIPSHPSYAIAVGLGNFAVGWGADAFGCGTSAFGNYAFTEGKDTFASWGAHAEGQKTHAEMPGCHAEGRFATSLGYVSHSQGHTVSAIGDFSFAAGTKASAKDSNSFVFNAQYNKYNTQNTPIRDDQLSTYESHGIGTFNVNTENGISGFYIGEKPLADIFPQLDDSNKIVTSSIPTVELTSNLQDIDQIEYIENKDEAFYIDSGIQISSLNNIRTELTFSANDIYAGGIFGYRQAYGKQEYGLQFGTSNYSLYVTPCIDSTQRLTFKFIASYVGKKLKAVMSKKIRAIYNQNDVAISAIDSYVDVNLSSDQTCYIFGFNGSSISNKSFNGKIYDISMYDDDTNELIHKFITKRNVSTNEIGLFDVVEKTWLYKQLESETFIAGQYVFDPYQREIWTMKQQIKELSNIINTITAH